MCGIAGVWAPEPRAGGGDPSAVVAAMTRSLSHRGPDGSGLWADAAAGLALGHRRLAIVDRSDAGRQPMPSASGRYVLAVNGELYNFQELRRELAVQHAAFRGACDSEVMVEAIDAWGLERSLERFEGMFAFALWDGVERTLHLVRDRIGEKPLYYGLWQGALMFASEIKALRRHPGFPHELDPLALAEFLRGSFVGGDRSIYRGVRKLAPGRRLAARGAPRPEAVAVTTYWSLAAAAESAQGAESAGGEEDAAEQLDDLLQRSVRRRLRADVQFGIFLSGGLDSTALLALAAGESTGPVRTFSIGMRHPHLDETAAARAIARHFGADHTERYLEDADAVELAPRLGEVFDEPFADASAIAVLAVSRLARGRVGTALAGDGADELLGGYRRYARADWLWRLARRVPGPVRRVGGRAIAALPAARARDLGRWLGQDDPYALHWHLLTHWKDPGPLDDRFEADWTASARRSGAGTATDFVLGMLQLDATNLLPDDLLVKVDRASMSVGLEVRLPFLDREVVEFCLGQPKERRVRRGRGKWLLRRVLERRVPRSLIQRGKKGFAVPLDGWLRGPLREWSEELLSERRLRESGLFATDRVRSVWHQHLAGRGDRSRMLWNVLMLQAWLEGRHRSLAEAIPA